MRRCGTDWWLNSPSCPKELNLHFSLAFSLRSQRSSLCQQVCVLSYSFMPLCHCAYTHSYCSHFLTHTHIYTGGTTETLHWELRARWFSLSNCGGKNSTLNWCNLEFLHNTSSPFAVFTHKCTNAHTHSLIHHLSVSRWERAASRMRRIIKRQHWRERLLLTDWFMNTNTELSALKDHHTEQKKKNNNQ